MLKKLSLILVLTCCIACNTKIKKEKLADLNLYLRSDLAIDSVFVSNISQDREFYFLPYSDTLKLKFKDSINDLYNIWFYSKDKKIGKQIWLNGKNLIIKGTIKDRFNIDTIIGSDLYYKGLNFQRDYRSLYKYKTQKNKMDSFLFAYIKKNINTPISLQAADYFFFQNKNDKAKIEKLHHLIKNQTKHLREHKAFLVHPAIKKHLSTTSIDLEKYAFRDINNQLSYIELKPNKKYILDIWFVNCLPCVKDHKGFLENPSLLSKNSIELIGISRDFNHDIWSKFIKKKKYPWKNFRQEKYNGSLTEDLYISIFPTYFLIEGNGKIIQTFNAYKDIEDYLQQ